MYDEGVIKFAAEHQDRPLDPRRTGEVACELIAWREVMALTGLVGQEPGRYGGAGYGNVSARIGRRSAGLGNRSFLITGTQTSGKRCIGLADFAMIERYDYAANRVWSHGVTQPSSESMTHGAIYDLGPHIRYVLHAHSPVLWRNAERLRLPTTAPSVAYGTPEMAREVQRLYRGTVLPERQILSLGGHEDGIVVFGRSVEEAGAVLVTWMARAYQLECGAADVNLCSW